MYTTTGLPWSQLVKNLLQRGRPVFHPWVGKIPWRREWQPTPVFLPGEFNGLRSLVRYSPCSLKESDTTEQLHTYTTCTITFESSERKLPISQKKKIRKTTVGKCKYTRRSLSFPKKHQMILCSSSILINL